MNKIKSLFSTPKKAVISIVCLAAIITCIGGGTAYAASTIAEGTSIGAANAQNFAFADAGVDPASATNVRTEFDFEQGQFVYEVEFTADGTEYDYWIKASNGAVVKKELEIITLTGDTVTATAQITLDEAKAVALADAGLSESDVTFTEEKLDVDDGVSMYDIDFYSGNVKYEYEINAATGTIYSKSKETTVEQPSTTDTSSAAGSSTTTDSSSSTDTSSAASSSADADSSSNSGTSAASDTTASATEQSSTQSVTTSVTLESAKSTALADAGLSESDVTFTKAKLDYDDGIAVYDIEFYSSTHEYEYEINATTGAIREKSSEAFKTSSTASSGSSSSGSSSYISVDEAKSIATAQAGLSVSDVTFKKAKLDHDDGIVEYEVEFYYGDMEYEVTINAVTGAVLEYDYEKWD